MVIAAIWAGVNFSEVRKYLSPSQIGNIAGNLHTRHNLQGALHKDVDQYLAQYSLALGLLIVRLLLVTALFQRKDRTQVALGLCAVTSVSLVIVSSYGNEGIYRVALFALPWLAIGASRVSRPEKVRLRAAASVAVLARDACGQAAGELALAVCQRVAEGGV